MKWSSRYWLLEQLNEKRAIRTINTDRYGTCALVLFETKHFNFNGWHDTEISKYPSNDSCYSNNLIFSLSFLFSVILLSNSYINFITAASLLTIMTQPNILCAKVENRHFQIERNEVLFPILLFSSGNFFVNSSCNATYFFGEIIEIDVVGCCMYRNRGILYILVFKLIKMKQKKENVPSSQTSSHLLEKRFYSSSHFNCFKSIKY